MSVGRCAIGVDLGGQSVKLAVVDSAGVIRLRRQVSIEATWSVEHITHLIVENVGKLGDEARKQGLAPSAVGMVMPGYMDRDRTELIFATNLPTLNRCGFLTKLRQALPLPVTFDADCNAAAVGESRLGAGRGVDRLIVAAVGTGIGAGVIIGGEVLRVWNHIAGSLGHVIVNARGPMCKCGARGCVEAMAAGPALERRAAELADEQPGSRLAAMKAEAGRLTGVEIGKALSEGDIAAQQAVDECGWWLGAGIASWAVIYRPDKVLVGGGVSALGEPYLAAVRRGLAAVGQPTATKYIQVEPAALGPEAGMIGAAAMVMSGEVTR